MSRRERQLRRRRNKGGPGRIILLTLGVLIASLAIGALSAVGWIVSVATSGPKISDLEARDNGATSVVYDADGKRLGFIQSSILRTPVTSEAIPQVMKDATVAIEDSRFFEHDGVDMEGIVRAAVKNVESGGEDVQGGSTLTMQLVRNLYTEDRARDGIEGYKRKIREAKLAEELEEVHTGREGKLWILNTYINNVPYGTVGGQSAIGVQAASRIFFDKPARQLELHEAALLAGLPQAPSLYNPFTSSDRATARRNDVLRNMAEEGYITDSEAAEAMARDLGVEQSRFYRFRTEGYFFDYVRQQLIDEYGVQRVRRGGLRVYTTIDRSLQRKARTALNDATGGQDRAAAIASVDPRNGHILAMASTGSYGDFKYNLASQGKYAPGSTFKIMALVAAVDRGVNPAATSYTSRPLNFTDPEFGKIDVKTYSNSYIGRANLVRATVASDNAIYQQLALDLGPDKVAEAARKLGVETRLDGFPAEVLGGLTRGVSPLEMANSYATIASGGWRNRETAITKVCFPEGPGGYDCRERKPRRDKAFSDGAMMEVTKILQQNVTGGTGTAAAMDCTSAGKTGTTDDFTDAWYVGYTPKVATSVWVGHAEGRRTLGEGAAGGTTAAPIWGQYMRSTGDRFCGQWPKVEQPFQTKPFFGKYARGGGPSGSQGGGSFNVDPNGAQDFETGGTANNAPTSNPAPVSPSPAAAPEAPAPVTPAVETPAAVSPDGGGAASSP